ncbi:MAG: hypothetical protein AAGG46_12910, partial [Planctomycetota bacterium]
MAEPVEPEAGASQLHDLYYGVHLPDNRRQSRRLDMAEELLAEQRYSEAAPLLLKLLEREQDSAYGVSAGSRDKFRSLQARTRAAVEKLDRESRQTYSLASDGVASRALSEAVKTGNRGLLSQVTRRYPETPQAAAAAWMLTRHAMHCAEYERALAWIDALDGDRRHGAAYEPQLSQMAAVCLVAVDKRNAAEARLSTVEPDRSDIDRLLNDATGFTNLHSRRQDRVWAGEGGDRRRTRSLPAGEPHLWASWRARLAVSNATAADSYRAAASRRRAGYPAILAGSPIATNGE